MRLGLLVVLLVGCKKDDPEPVDGSVVGDTGETGGPSDAVPACYLGARRDHRTCLDAEPLPASVSGYDYPAPFSGSQQYRAPLRYLDLRSLDRQRSLAPNFVLGELASLGNTPFAVVQTHAVDHLQAVRDEVGPIMVNSGYRSPGYNATIPGSASSSRHLYGDGFDLDPSSVTLDDLAAACEDEGAAYVEVYVAHVHCDWRDDPLDPAFYGSARAAAWSVTPRRDATVVWRGDRLEAPASGFDEGEPLRVWSAFDADGARLTTEIGADFEPPADAAVVEVEVGRVVQARLVIADR